MDMISCPPRFPGLPESPAAEPAPTLGKWYARSLYPWKRSPRGPADRPLHPALHGTGAPRWRAGELAEGFQDFPVRPDELRTQPVNHEKVLKWYEDRTGLDGRYRVLEVIDGTGPGLVRGKTIYRRPMISRICLPPATNTLLPVRGPYAVGRLPHAGHGPTGSPPDAAHRDRRDAVSAPMRAGEQITLEARLRVQDGNLSPGTPGGLTIRPHDNAGSYDAPAPGFAMTRLEPMGAAVAEDRQEGIVQAVRLVPCGGVVFYASVPGNSATSTGCEPVGRKPSPSRHHPLGTPPFLQPGRAPDSTGPRSAGPAHLLVGEHRGPAISFSTAGEEVWAALCATSRISHRCGGSAEFQEGYPVHRVFTHGSFARHWS